MLEPLLIGLPLIASLAVWILMFSHSRLAWAIATAVPLVQAALLLSLATPYHPPLLNIFVGISGLSAVLLFAIFIGLAIQTVYSKDFFQGDNFFLLALIFNAGITTAILLVRQLALAGLTSAAILMIAIYALRGRYKTSHTVDAALRMVVAAAIASVAFLISVLLIDAYTSTHDEQLIRIVAGVLSVAVGLLVAVFPFHFWQPKLSESVPPMVATWMMCFVAVATIGTLLFTAETYPWLHSMEHVAQILRVLATLSAVVAAFLALTSKSVERTVVFANGSAIASALVGIASVSIPGITGATFALATQVLAMVLLMMIVGQQNLTSTNTTSEMQADGRPLGNLSGLSFWGFLVGGLALAGMPPFGGFAGRWLIYQAVANDPALVVGLLLASAMLALAFLRLILTPKRATDQSEPRVHVSATHLSIGIVALMLVVVGIFPNHVLSLIIDTLATFPGLA